MYRKLSLRSACRDWQDYLLYTLTLTVPTGVMSLSELSGLLGGMAGFQTASLPLLVGLITVILLRYISRFLLRQRAQEFALYLLMGMERRTLAGMFFLELFFLSCLCLAVGILLGICLGAVLWALFPGGAPGQAAFAPAALSAAARTAGYFLAIQLLSLASTVQLICRMEIRELRGEKQRDQSQGLRRVGVWTAASAISALLLAVSLLGIGLLPENAAGALVGLVSLPLLALVGTFYQALYGQLNRRRRLKGETLYRGDRLYLTAQFLSGGSQAALLDSVLCLCLLFAAAAFLFGGIMLSRALVVMSPISQRYMGLMQISICVIFTVIYFAVLSLRQAVDVQRARQSIKTLHHLGKSGREIRSLLVKQTCLRFAAPLLLCLPILAAAVSLAGFRLAIPLLTAQLSGAFLLCFAALYSLYAWAVCRISAQMVYSP